MARGRAVDRPAAHLAGAAGRQLHACADRLGLIFYFLVNGLDMLRGFTGWTVPGTIGDIYRLVADVLSVGALVAMAWFLLRRFVFKSPVLNYRENIKLTEQVEASRIRQQLADRRHLHPLPHRLPLPGRELRRGAAQRSLAALRHGRQRSVGPA